MGRFLPVEDFAGDGKDQSWKCTAVTKTFSKLVKGEDATMSNRYQIYVDDTRDPSRVFVISHYAGKPVRGISKCAPGDEFDLSHGVRIAKLRCDLKVAKLRQARANRRHAEAIANLEEAQNQVKEMARYLSDSTVERTRLQKEYDELLKKFKE